MTVLSSEAFYYPFCKDDWCGLVRPGKAVENFGGYNISVMSRRHYFACSFGSDSFFYTIFWNIPKPGIWGLYSTCPFQGKYSIVIDYVHFNPLWFLAMKLVYCKMMVKIVDKVFVPAAYTSSDTIRISHKDGRFQVCTSLNFPSLMSKVCGVLSNHY